MLPVALPGPEEQPPANDNVAGRPAIGPVLPLNATSAEKGGQLLGAASHQDERQADPLATRVLNRGEAIVAPRGRADDFSWPRPDISGTADTEALPNALPPKGAAVNKGAENGKKNTDKAATTKSSGATNPSDTVFSYAPWHDRQTASSRRLSAPPAFASRVRSSPSPAASARP